MFLPPDGKKRWKNWPKNGILRNMPSKIEISHKTIIFSAFFILLLWFLYLVRDLILELFVSLLIMTILNPFVTRLSRFKVPRAVSVLIAYLIVFGLFGVAIAGVVPPLIEQSTSFANNLPKYFASLGYLGNVTEQLTTQLLSQIGSLPGQVLRFSVSIFSNVLAILTVLIFSFYMLLARNKMDDQLGVFFAGTSKKKIARIIDSLERRMGGWARGQMLLMIAVGAATYAGLSLMGIPFALPLGILAGLLEIIPYIGPIFSAVPAVVIGLSISPLKALAVAGLFFLVQQLENYVLVPKIMEKSVGVSPLVTLISLAIGFRMAGVAGAVISIPVVLSLQVLIREYLFTRDS
jgi:predicted PurR-regulated permease PerM